MFKFVDWRPEQVKQDFRMGQIQVKAK